MPIMIRIVSGENSPWEKEFDQDEITVGRAESSDVRLHPLSDTVCASGIHARLTRHDERWQLRIEHRNGAELVTANGHKKRLQLSDETEIETECHLTIGERGPVIRITPPVSRIPSTVQHSNRLQPIGGVPGDVIHRARSAGARIILLTITVLILVAVVGWLSREVGGVKTKFEVFALGNPHPRNSDLTTDHRKRFEDLLEDAKQSVYLVASKGHSGAISEIGTAWAFSDSLLATNAHVAEEAERVLARGLDFVARLPGKESKDVQITGVRIHPGYQEWNEIFNKNPFGDSAVGPRDLSFLPVCDVAFLEVAEPVKPLTVAAESELERLTSGEVVGYVGFPAENIPISRAFSEPSVFLGRIVSVTDFFFQSASPKNRYLLHFDMVAAGGASGSPIFNESGHVVGILSAGSSVFTEGGRAPVGLNFGQRIDLLTELAEGHAKEFQDARNKAWISAIDKIVLKPKDRMDTFVEHVLPEMMERPDAQFEMVTEFENSISATLNKGKGYGIEQDIDLRQPGSYIFLANCSDWSDLHLSVFSPGGELIGEDEGKDFMSAVGLEVDDVVKVRIRIAARATRVKSPIAYFRIVRLLD